MHQPIYFEFSSCIKMKYILTNTSLSYLCPRFRKKMTFAGYVLFVPEGIGKHSKGEAALPKAVASFLTENG